MPSLAYLYGAPSDSLPLRHLAEAVQTRAQQLGAAGDSAGFQGLAGDWEKIFRRWLEADGSLIDSLVVRSSLGTTATRFEKVADDLDLPNELAKWRRINEWMEADKERRTTAPGQNIHLRSGILASLLLPVISNASANAPEITDQDLRPTRLADHELFGRLFSAVIWVALALMLTAAGLYRFRSSLLIRRLAGEFEKLLRPSDWAWILGVGILLPCAWHLSITRLTPLGGREWGLEASEFMVPSGQFSAMGWLMIVLPVLVARRRLARRGAVLGFSLRRPWLTVVTAAGGFLAIPVLGLGLAGPAPQEPWIIAGGALLTPLILTWLVIGARAIFSMRPKLLRRVILSRTLLPAYALGMLLMAAAIPAHHAAERHWFAQDRLLEITPEALPNRYEYEVAKAIRQEIRALLEAAW